MNEGTKEINPQFGSEEILDHVKELRETAEQKTESKGLFIVKPANKWLAEAALRPIPKPLYGTLWYEDELCIEFGDTNTGKSIKAVQIGIDISQDKKVLYFDFELSDKQFEARYSVNYKDHFSFSPNFLRVEINQDANVPKNSSFEDFLVFSIEKSIIETGAKILIIDNLTYLRAETEKAKDALPLMKQLKALKSKYGLSILALAHTPKRDASKPLTRNDLQGSKMLINFCDSAFAIGESFKDKNVRYIKQIKARATEIIHDAENVCIYEIVKPGNFLHFHFIGYGREREHLNMQTDGDRESLIEQAKELSKSGKSQRLIATELGISLGAVNKYLHC